MSKLLGTIGLDGRRIRMVNISSAMGGRFAELAAEMTEQIRGLGPNPLRSAGRRVSPQGELPTQPGNQS